MRTKTKRNAKRIGSRSRLGWYARILATCILELLRDPDNKDKELRLYAKKLLISVYKNELHYDDFKPRKYASIAIEHDDDPFDLGEFGRRKLNPPLGKTNTYSRITKGFKPQRDEAPLV